MVVGRGIDVLLLLLLLLFLVPGVVVVVVVDIRQSGKSCTEYRALSFFSYARLSPLSSPYDAYSSPNSSSSRSSSSSNLKKLLTTFQEGPTLPAPTSLGVV